MDGAESGEAQSSAPRTSLPPPTVAWPDEASRRLASSDHQVSTPQEAVAALDDSDRAPDPGASTPPLERLPLLPVSPETRRRLGPLAGFAASPRADIPKAQEPNVQTSPEQNITVNRSRQRHVRRSIGQLRIVQFRKRRIIVRFTRFRDRLINVHPVSGRTSSDLTPPIRANGVDGHFC